MTTEKLSSGDIDSLICAVDFLTDNSENVGVHERSKTLLIKLRSLRSQALKEEKDPDPSFFPVPLVACTFTSVWDESEITTACKYNPKTGQVFPESSGVDVDGILDREFITVQEYGNQPVDRCEKEFEVCPNCHEYLTEVAMVPGIGVTLDETKVCRNPDCG